MTSFWGHQDNSFPPDEPRRPRCPVCGEECETIYGEDVQEDDPWEDCRCMEDY